MTHRTAPRAASRCRRAPPGRPAWFKQAVNRLGAQDEGLERIRESLTRRAARLQAMTPRDANIVQILSALVQESIKDMSEQRKYLLARLQEANKITDDLGEQQKRLADASAKLAHEEKKDQEKKKLRSR
jgi:hypothetical protein